MILAPVSISTLPVNPSSAGTDIMVMKTGWIQASPREIRPDQSPSNSEASPRFNLFATKSIIPSQI